MSQIERIHWINGVLTGEDRYLHWRTVAEKFEVNRRTVFNDAAYLRDRLQAPLVFNRKHNGWHYNDKSYQLPFLALSDKEKDMLSRMLRAAAAQLPPADAAAASRLALRLSPYVRGLPTYDEALSPSSEVFQPGHSLLSPEYTLTETLLTDIRRAVENRHRIQITYYSAHRDEITERVVQPYNLLNSSGELYLIGYCERRADTRDFGLHRIRAYEVLEPDRAFVVPDIFDLDAYLNAAFSLRRGEPTVTVRARFSPKQSRWIRERIYHPSQTSVEEPDGSIVLALTVSGIAEAKKWLLSYGSEVKVLEPEELRREIASETEAMRQIYAPAE